MALHDHARCPDLVVRPDVASWTVVSSPAMHFMYEVIKTLHNALAT
jgi:hypothetical protein